MAAAKGKGAPKRVVSKGARATILEAVNSASTAEQIQALIDGVFAAAQGIKTGCPHCHEEHLVQVPDYKRIVDGITALVQEAEGRPEQRSAEATQVTIIRPPL